MATIYASAPGTGSGGSGSSGSPFNNIFEALANASPTDNRVIIKGGGVITASMAWNSLLPYGGWQNGTALSPITVEAEDYAGDTILSAGIPAGTSAVTWRAAGGNALNMGVPSGIQYWRFKGITFDAQNLNQVTGYISLNNNARQNIWQNCVFKNLALNTGVICQFVEFAGGGTKQIHNNIVRACHFQGTSHVNTSHYIYCRQSGNIFEHNEAEGGVKAFVQYFVGSSASSGSIDDNIVRFNYIHDFPAAVSGNAIFSHSLNINRNYHYGNIIVDSPTRVGFYLQGGSGYSGNAVGNSFCYNTIYNLGVGIKIRDEALASQFIDTLIKNNISYGCTTNIDLGSYSTNTLASNNSTDGTDPDFVDAPNEDYSLEGTSPLLTSGVALGSPYDDRDFAGIARPQGANPTIGAYEYSTGLTPVPPVNVYANPGGYTVFLDTSTSLPVSVIDDNSPSPLYVRTSFRVNGGGTLTIDVSGGGSVS